jgi:hypothetical protein
LAVFIVPENDMEDEVVVGRVAMMTVLAEGAGRDMQLYVALQLLARGGDDGVAEVGAGPTRRTSPVGHP